jgi:ATP-dependent metalloprotease FtsH
MSFFRTIGIVYLLCNIITDGYNFNLNHGNNLISNQMFYKKKWNPYGHKYRQSLNKIKQTVPPELNSYSEQHKYPISKQYFEDQLRRLNSQNNTCRDNNILGIEDAIENEETYNFTTLQLIFNQDLFNALGLKILDNEYEIDEDQPRYNSNNKESKSENFEVIRDYNIKFIDVGGYENVKEELRQCVDLLKNYKKYEEYNVRIPKGLILEGPPGTGKTLLSRALAGEAGCGFIAVSGSDFQNKYVGVGSTRIKELFKLGKSNVPCIIFIDEIDAVGRKRSSDGESSSNERDSTLNALLVELDGFKNNTGIFLVAATNRIDLLDDALVRPGRVDKKIFIGLPDSATRKSIIDIHIKGKPYDNSIIIIDLVETTDGLSGAQIENLLNEAMLNALRYNRVQFTRQDFELVLNKMMAGWQPNEHEFTSDIIDHIAIHEMGHAIVGIFSKHHSKVSKVVINLSSPKSPGYTVFETSVSNIYTREALFEHLMILLSGRIAEEIFYGVSVTTGAINDFEEALKLAEKMVLYYGMGSKVIYPKLSDRYKELIDNDVNNLITSAYKHAEDILYQSKSLIKETSELLKRDKHLSADLLNQLIKNKYADLLQLIIDVAS